MYEPYLANHGLGSVLKIITEVVKIAAGVRR